MTSELRAALKREIDAAVRERESRGAARTTCKGCGVREDRYLDDCRTCWNRRYNRERYAKRPGRMSVSPKKYLEGAKETLTKREWATLRACLLIYLQADEEREGA